MRGLRAVFRHRSVRWHRAAVLPVLIATLGLCACGRVAVLAADPWWSAVTGRSAAFARGVALAALRRGYVTTFVAVSVKEDARARLLEALPRLRAGAAVLGPPLSFAAGDIASRFPSVTFVLVDGPGIEDGIPNTVQLSFDRRAAFQAAGALAAAAGPAAVLSAAGRSDAETAAFVDGVLSVPGAPAPLLRALSDPPDQNELRAAVADLRTAGISVFLYRPTSSGAQFLEVLAATGGCAVVEDWAASRPRPQQVLVSIEDDLAAGIGACLARGAPPLVVAPARLVRGNAGEAADGRAGGP